MAEHNDLGKLGEAKAIEHLQRNGYRILETNWRFRKGEIDIIAQKDNTLVIVEVKTRSYVTVMNPEDAVTEKKKKLLVETTNQYLMDNDIDLDTRFDIITVVKQKNTFHINHIEDAFYFF